MDDRKENFENCCIQGRHGAPCRDTSAEKRKMLAKFSVLPGT